MTRYSRAAMAACGLVALAVTVHAQVPKYINGCQIAPKSQCQNANLSATSFADLNGINLVKASLQGANLSGADMSGVEAAGANLSGADMSGVDAQGANFSDADLRGANLARAKLDGANLSGALWTDGRKCAPGSVGSCK